MMLLQVANATGDVGGSSVTTQNRLFDVLQMQTSRCTSRNNIECKY